MPIPKWKQSYYPKNWKEIADSVKERAGWCCELCGKKHGDLINPKEPVKDDKTRESIVVLTVHHFLGLLHPLANKPENLIAVCQRCHLRLDQPFKRMNKKIMEMVRANKMAFLVPQVTDYGVVFATRYYDGNGGEGLDEGFVVLTNLLQVIGVIEE